jgi:hypothetical protein
MNHDLVPTEQGLLAIGILLPKLDQGIAQDHMHNPSVSQIEITVNRESTLTDVDLGRKVTVI